FALHAEAARNALADAGLRKDDVDAVFSAGLWMGSETAEYLGIRPRYVDGTQIGGCSFIAHVEHAMAAIDTGLCDVALITHGESSTHVMVSQMPDFARWDAARMAGERAFAMAGIRHADVDVAELYDAFTIVPIMALEALGFCKEGEGGAFVAAGRTAPGGDF